jgi:hypothetical protein
MSRERRKVRLRVDGKPLEFEVKGELAKAPTSALLRLVEYKYLLPERSIKHVELKGEKLHPAKLDEIKDTSSLNVITEPSANMVGRQIEVALMALDGMAAAIEQIAQDWNTKPELARVMLHSLLDSLDWTVKLVESGAKILPLYEGVDEEIARLEEAVFELDDLMYEGKEEEALKVLTSRLKPAVLKWKEFLREFLRFSTSAPKGLH